MIIQSKHKQSVAKPLNHGSVSINTRSSGQVRQFLVRFLPLEKEQGHKLSYNKKHELLLIGPVQTNPLNDLHVIVIDGIYLIVHIVRIVLS